MFGYSKHNPLYKTGFIKCPVQYERTGKDEKQWESWMYVVCEYSFQNSDDSKRDEEYSLIMQCGKRKFASKEC